MEDSTVYMVERLVWRKSNSEGGKKFIAPGWFWLDDTPPRGPYRTRKDAENAEIAYHSICRLCNGTGEVYSGQKERVGGWAGYNKRVMKPCPVCR